MSPRDAQVPEEGADTQDTADDLMAGFQETVSVSEDSFPAEFDVSDANDEGELTETVAEAIGIDDVMEDAVALPPDVLGNRSEGDQDAPVRILDESEYYEAEVSQSATAAAPPAADTAVLRRSLLDTPPPKKEETPNFEEVVIEEPTMLEGGTVLPTLPSKAGVRWLSALLTLVLTPVTWYLLADAGARLAFAEGNPMDTGVINPAAIAELVAGLLLIVLIALVTAQSALGLTISGTIVLLVGAVFIVVPGMADQLMTYLQPFRDYNDFGWNVVSHLEFTGFTGLLLTAGFAMVATAWVVFSVRRAGRREEAMRVEIAASNPSGLKARWARKATAKSYDS